MPPSFCLVCNPESPKHTLLKCSRADFQEHLPHTPPLMLKYLEFLRHRAAFHIPAHVILPSSSGRFSTFSLHLPLFTRELQLVNTPSWDQHPFPFGFVDLFSTLPWASWAYLYLSLILLCYDDPICMFFFPTRLLESKSYVLFYIPRNWPKVWHIPD